MTTETQLVALTEATQSLIDQVKTKKSALDAAAASAEASRAAAQQIADSFGNVNAIVTDVTTKRDQAVASATSASASSTTASAARDVVLALTKLANSFSEGVAYATDTTGSNAYFAVRSGGMGADGITPFSRTTCFRRTSTSTATPFATVLSGDEFDSVLPPGYDAVRTGYLHLWLDSNNRVLLGVKRDGTFWSKGINLTSAATDANTALTLANNAKDAGTSIQIKSRSIYLHEWWDSAQRLLMYVAPNGDLYSKGINLTDTARNANTLVFPGPERSKYLHQFQDNQNRLLGGFLKNGELEVKGVNVSQSLSKVPTVINEAIPSTDFVIFGDSLTEGAGSSGGQTLGVQLAALYSTAGQTRSVYSSGFGGQSCAAILARFGAAPTLVTFPIPSGGLFCQIPASGTASVTVTNAPLSYAAPEQAKSMTGSIMGIAGTLTRLANTNDYTFTRSTPGSATNVAPGVPFLPDTQAYRYRTFVCFIGTNDMTSKSAAEILAYIDTYLAWQATFQKRRVIVMPAINSLSSSVEGIKTKYADLLTLVKAKYPYEFVDSLFELQKNNNGSSDDLAAVAAGLAPPSLQSGDKYHLNNAGYGVIAQAIKNNLDLRGF